MLYRILNAALGVLIAICLIPVAHSEQPNYYGALSMTWALFNNDFDVTISELHGGSFNYGLELERGLALSAMCGKNFSESFQMEVELSYRYNSFDTIFFASLKTHDFIAMVNAYYQELFLDFFSLFASVGAGIIETTGSGTYSYNSYEDLDHFGFAYSLKLGYGLRVSSVVMIYSSYQFFAAPNFTANTGSIYCRSTGCPDEIIVSNVSIANHAFESGIRYYF